MRIEPKQAFYNDATGAVQPWKDIEVTDAVGNSLVAEGLVTEIEGGGGGGGDFNVANVTVSTGEDQFFSVDAIKDDGGIDYTSIWESEDGFNTNAMLNDGEEKIFKLWYHGDSVNVYPNNVVESVTGDAVYDSGTNFITITGDCTITGYTDD